MLHPCLGQGGTCAFRTPQISNNPYSGIFVKGKRTLLGRRSGRWTAKNNTHFLLNITLIEISKKKKKKFHSLFQPNAGIPRDSVKSLQINFTWVSRIWSSLIQFSETIVKSLWLQSTENPGNNTLDSIPHCKLGSLKDCPEFSSKS